MVGERYFAARQRLAGLMGAIASLAERIGVPAAGTLPLDELATGLGPPFIFAVCGEVNAGKSAFFNGLIGRELCPMSKLPETTAVMWYRHGEVAAEATGESGLREIFRPLAVLRDFWLLDTPGLQSVPTAANRLAESLLGKADAVFVVLPLANPWGAPAWNLISRLPKATLDRVILIVQQADLAAPADVPVVLGHLRELAIKRVGHALPVFPVSAKLAFAARQSQPPDARQLAASGYPALENHLSTRVCGAPERNELLRTWARQAENTLQVLEQALDTRGDTMRHHSEFLASVEAQIVGLNARFIARLPSHLQGVADVFRREAEWVAGFLAKRLGVFRSFGRVFFGDRTSHQVETVFVERLQAAICAVAEQDGTEVEAACRSHRESLVREVRATMGVDLEADVSCGERLAAARSEFVSRVSDTAGARIGELKVRGKLTRDLLRRNRALKSFMFLALLLLIAAGTGGAFGYHLVAMILCGLAGGVLVGGGIVSFLTKKLMRADFQERLLTTCDGFAETLREDYENALRDVFRTYLETLGPIRAHLVATKASLEPSQRRAGELLRLLKEIEQGLD